MEREYCGEYGYYQASATGGVKLIPMAEIKLNTTTSIVDLMKSLGKPSDYNSRANLYKESGLADRLGSYVGSASQNTAFIKSLGTPSLTGAI